MAVSTTKEYPLGSPLVHIKICDSHGSPIDIICEDCDEFICAKCAKTDHRDHEWNTLPTAATQKRRGLLSFLTKIKEENLPGIDGKMEKIPQQMTENKYMCDSEIKKLQKHYDEIINSLSEIKKCHDQRIRDNLVKKNDQLNHVKSELEKKKRGIVDIVEFMEENNSTMSDYSLIDNHRELIKMLSELEVHMTNCEYSVRFTRAEYNEKLLESVIGKFIDLDDVSVTKINSFQYGDKPITVLEACNEDQCYVKEYEPESYTEKVNQQGKKYQQFRIFANDICMTENKDIYFTDFSKNSTRCLSPSGSVSTVIRTNPLEPMGICQSVNGGLLVTLADNESDDYKLDSHSRRLVRHITVKGVIIHEYEYKDDGQTRLFTWPERVTQNGNSDIYVVNRTSGTTGELMIMSPSGYMKSIYYGQGMKKNFDPTAVVFDSLCNVLVTDYNKQIHLLSPDGEFLKFLLTDNEISRPSTLSLYKSTLWVGYGEGCVKVFQYRM